MANIEVKKENKLKKFLEDHKAEIVAAGFAVLSGATIGLVARKSYKTGFIDGGAVGANVMVDWLEKTFPGESNANELLTRYKAEHPEDIVYYKRPGVWSAK